MKLKKQDTQFPVLKIRHLGDRFVLTAQCRSRTPLTPASGETQDYSPPWRLPSAYIADAY